MRDKKFVILVILFICSFLSLRAQIIQSVTFEATDDNMIEVKYYLTTDDDEREYDVKLFASMNGGKNFFLAKSTKGDVGMVKGNGLKKIVWNVLSDIETFEGEECVMKVTAEQVKTFGDQMGNVAGGIGSVFSAMFTASAETEDFLNADKFHIGLLRSDFNNKYFDRALDKEILKRVAGFALGGDIVSLPFDTDFNFFLQMYSIDATNLYQNPFLDKDSTNSILHLGMNISTSLVLFPSLKYVVPSAGVGYQISSLMTGSAFSDNKEDTASVAVTSSVFWIVNVHLNVSESVHFGFSYREAFGTRNKDLKQIFVLEERKWSQVYVSIAF
jgi:hypothetical protein